MIAPLRDVILISISDGIYDSSECYSCSKVFCSIFLYFRWSRHVTAPQPFTPAPQSLALSTFASSEYLQRRCDLVHNLQPSSPSILSPAYHPSISDPLCRHTQHYRLQPSRTLNPIHRRTQPLTSAQKSTWGSTEISTTTNPNIQTQTQTIPTITTKARRK